MRDAMLADSRLQELLSEEGPFLSLYLNTEVADESAAHEIEVRWRRLRESADDAADDAGPAALDEVVEGSHQRGKGLVAFAAQGRVPYRRYLSRPVDDSFTAGSLPRLLPLIEWRQEHPPHALVLAHRGGAEIYVARPQGSDARVSVEGAAGSHVERTASGGSERNLQHRAENLVEENAAEVAQELHEIVRTQGIELVLLAGDERALGQLRAHLPVGMEDDFVDVGEHAPRGGSFEDMQPELDEAVSAHVAGETSRMLERLRVERGKQAAEGAGEVLEALRKAQVDTLVLTKAEDERRAWFSHEHPGQAALDKGTLTDLSIDDVAEGPLLDVLIHAAYVTGAGVRVATEMPADESPAQGVGALLRYS